jgi:hypothetical protein
VILIAKNQKPFDVMSKGFWFERIGTTRRLLNFFWQASRAWKLEFDGNSKMVNSRLVLAVLSKASEGA